MSDFNKSQITQKGHALLAKVLANTTDLTFTKVVAGDGTYTGDVWDLTEMISPKLQGSIIGVSVVGAVSKIVCSINNATLENYLEFREIGIYANDPDEGEILFSYANAGDRFDYIAAYNGEQLVEEEITFNVYTANATNINAVVEHTGYASQIDFNNAGSSLNSTRVESAIKEVSNKMDQLSNLNLLINSNFRRSELVNQRAQTSYQNTGYTFDMWSINTNIKLDLTGEFVKIDTSTTKGGRLSYTIENCESLKGKTVTLSLNSRFVSNIGQGFVRFIYVNNSVQYTIGVQSINKTNGFATVQVTVQLPEDMSYLRIDIYGIDEDIELNYIKLEIGEIATPFLDDDPAIKLNKCRRYLTVIDKNNNDFILHNVINTNYLDFIYYINEMRTIPTVSIKNDLTIGALPATPPQTGFTFTTPYNKKGSIMLRAHKVAHGLTATNYPIIAFVEANIIISAEL